jgi:hypothetical protein
MAPFPTMEGVLEPSTPIPIYRASMVTEGCPRRWGEDGNGVAPLDRAMHMPERFSRRAPQSKSRPNILAFNSDTGNLYQ